MDKNLKDSNRQIVQIYDRIFKKILTLSARAVISLINGLFGTEELTDIGPAVEAAKERGINTVGPCPADSVFNIGKSGKFDAILSLYHDQGHIACKTLDFEKSVTLTFGLPFIRSSVDHGTAFDIAGKGIAGCVSLIESTKVVAEYAAKQHEKEM